MNLLLLVSRPYIRKHLLRYGLLVAAIPSFKKGRAG